MIFPFLDVIIVDVVADTCPPTFLSPLAVPPHLPLPLPRPLPLEQEATVGTVFADS